MHVILLIVNCFYYVFALEFFIAFVQEVKARKCENTATFCIAFSIVNVIKRALESYMNSIS